MTFKVLIADKMSPKAEQVFEKYGIAYDVNTGNTQEQLKSLINDYDAVALRSSSHINKEIIDNAYNLKVIGRAGIGVDNVDVSYASKKGVVVMNTPNGNSTTTAEHAIAMLLSLSRSIPQANTSTHKGIWAKSKFVGREITGKTLGLIGCGNIGTIVANRAIGLKMSVCAYDPYLSDSKAVELRVKKVTLEELLKISDYISLHVPKTEQTVNMLNKDTLAQTKRGVYIINCARGGLVNEDDLVQAIANEQVAGAAIDVYSNEPATESVLFNNDKIICTPHLGASTSEAQEIVAVQIAEQISDYLLNGAINNAINMPSLTKEDAIRLKPYLSLATYLGSMAGQLHDEDIKAIKIKFEGDVASISVQPLVLAIVETILCKHFDSVNMVNSLSIAKEKDIKIESLKSNDKIDYHSLITITMVSSTKERALSGTISVGGENRISSIKSIALDARFSKHMLYTTNKDKPGFIAHASKVLSDANINIATFNLGRDDKGGNAICLIEVDEKPNEETIAKLKEYTNLNRLILLNFE